MKLQREETQVILCTECANAIRVRFVPFHGERSQCRSCSVYMGQHRAWVVESEDLRHFALERFVTEEDLQFVFELTRTLATYGLIGRITDDERLTRIRSLHVKISAWLQIEAELILDPRLNKGKRDG